jgi:hypothetical protein
MAIRDKSNLVRRNAADANGQFVEAKSSLNASA